MINMLKINDLCKRYGSHTILNNLSLTVAKGQIYGLVGPNGAGKTTLIKIIAGLLEPDCGTISVDGEVLDTRCRRNHIEISYMPDYFGVYHNFKVYEYMEFFAQAYGIKGIETKHRIDEKLQLVDLSMQREDYVDKLSRGMKQRLCLARCLLAEPQLLLLDEPASGLDPRARRLMNTILKHLQERDMAIVISSHILEDLSRVCSHIGIMEDGEIVKQGTIEDILKLEEQMKPLNIRFTQVNASLYQSMQSNPLITNLRIDGALASMNFQGDTLEEARLLRSLIEDGADICYFAREKGNLEKLFLQITKGD